LITEGVPALSPLTARPAREDPVSLDTESFSVGDWMDCSPYLWATALAWLGGTIRTTDDYRHRTLSVFEISPQI
jgi:hypothetical protein